MTNQEILEKAISKAIAGGWKKPYDWDELEWNGKSWHTYEWGIDLNTVIYSHDFAKALWPGEKEYLLFIKANGKPGDYGRVPAWQFHLQQMVIADDPIKYLEEHV